MGVYPTAWAGPVFVEAMRFWFFALSISIALSSMELWTLWSEPVEVKLDEKDEVKEKDEAGEANEKTDKKASGAGEVQEKAKDEAKQARSERSHRTRATLKKLVADIADLFIPGTITGWLNMSAANVGWMGVLSTTITMAEVWKKVQRS